MPHEAPFLITPILFGSTLAVVGVFILLWERAQERKRKDAEAPRDHAKTD
ncbi:MAG TPA: hypothetical protein VMT64_07860 [Candidatus Binataceae bacterium]|nr:hypothetical protein [Candidatus Binataceae bacterium]